MTHHLGLQELLLRLLIHPFRRDTPVPFTSSLSGADRVLIYLPAGVNAKEAAALFKKMDAVFPGKKLQCLCDPGDEPAYKGRAVPVDQQGMHILNAGNHPAIGTLAGESIDLFIDLRPEPGLLNLYICRRFYPPVRACLKSGLSSRYYNLEFTPNALKSATENGLDLLTCIGGTK
ncbi:hypothetical protein JXO52_15695 [bacterium]|nr:hypothetical protein [bacterium]